jgi:hypothetical protein
LSPRDKHIQHEQQDWHTMVSVSDIGLIVQTSHGAPALMDAIRALLRAALAAPHNQQFLLLSESEVSTLA